MKRQEADAEAKEETECQGLREAVAQRLHRCSFQRIPHLPALSANPCVERACQILPWKLRKEK